ncbi:MAG: ABC transporter [Sulfobacillus benefaciens]|uniref:ABC transporter n=1 Tax=Sulfobacillus benefaciens TaxID=453960 RepID=A0A2T2XI39_9FIRM|nr:MAG: ABC transporter [Sulfobacillus benefaciens]
MSLRKKQAVPKNPLVRTYAIFALALSYWRDARAIARAKRRLPEIEAKAKEARIYELGGERFRREALRLGGLIIKVGQFLSARTDVLPLEFTRQLASLQDQVPAASYSEVQQLLESVYQKPVSEVFRDFGQEPVAAASLGQVHHALLRDEGQDVAVKVRRPGIKELASIDLRALALVMAALKRWTRAGRRLDTVRIFREFRDMVNRELDYVQERQNLEAFAENFKDNPAVKIPQVYPAYSSKSVLVMEYVSGYKLTDHEALVKAGLDPKALAHTLVNTFLQQIVVDGVVQIDPHPGNFFAGYDGKLIFLDFGMIGHIPPEHLAYAAQLVEGVLSQDASRVVDAIDGLGFLAPHAQKQLLQRAMTVLLNRSAGTPLSPGPQLTRVVSDFQDFLYEEPLLFPAQYMFLGRAIGMLFGLISALDPDLDWLQVLRQEALPLINARRQAAGPSWLGSIRRAVTDMFGAEAATLVDTIGRRVWDTVLMAGRLPGSVDRIVATAAAGELVTRPELTQMMRRVDRIGDLIESLVFLLAFFGVAASGFLFMNYHWIVLRDGAWAFSILFLLWFVRLKRRANRRLRQRHIMSEQFDDPF